MDPEHIPQTHHHFPPPPPRPTSSSSPPTSLNTPTTSHFPPPTSPTYSYASHELEIIPVEPRSSAHSPDSRRSRTRQELNSAFFEELEDMPMQEAQVRRMSIRRMRVPLSGESLRSTVGQGRASGPRSSGGGRADWQKEQREWEERAEAVTDGAEQEKEGGAGLMTRRRDIGLDEIIYNGNNYRDGGNVTSGDRNLSWETGDDAGALDQDGSPSPSKWRRFFAWVLTWKGILITIYSLNVVAWGGMLFLLLVNAAPAMCHPSCNDINSPRRIWVEIDSQILNALFCVTGFGLIPWRFRDLYLLMRYRIRGDTAAWETLRGVHHKWDTWLGKPWKVDLVVHLYCFNSYFQAVLAGLMWGMTRYTRPAAGTGAAVAASFLVAMWAGLIEWREGSKVKKARAARRSDGGENGQSRGVGMRMSQMSRGTEGEGEGEGEGEVEGEEEREVKRKEAGLI